MQLVRERETPKTRCISGRFSCGKLTDCCPFCTQKCVRNKGGHLPTKFFFWKKVQQLVSAQIKKILFSLFFGRCTWFFFCMDYKGKDDIAHTSCFFFLSTILVGHAKSVLFKELCLALKCFFLLFWEVYLWSHLSPFFGLWFCGLGGEVFFQL